MSLNKEPNELLKALIEKYENNTDHYADQEWDKNNLTEFAETVAQMQIDACERQILAYDISHGELSAKIIANTRNICS